MDQTDVAAYPAQICGLYMTISVAIQFRSEPVWVRIPVGIVLGIIDCAIIAIGIFYAIRLVGRMLANYEKRKPRLANVLFNSFVVLSVLAISCGTMYLSFLFLRQLGWSSAALLPR